MPALRVAQGPDWLAGHFKGKEKKPTIVLEGTADREGCIWFMFYGLLGSLNDLNVMDKATTREELFKESSLPE